MSRARARTIIHKNRASLPHAHTDLPCCAAHTYLPPRTPLALRLTQCTCAYAARTLQKAGVAYTEVDLGETGMVRSVVMCLAMGMVRSVVMCLATGMVGFAVHYLIQPVCVCSPHQLNRFAVHCVFFSPALFLNLQQSALVAKTGKSSVPQVFAKGTFVGTSRQPLAGKFTLLFSKMCLTAASGQTAVAALPRATCLCRCCVWDSRMPCVCGPHARGNIGSMVTRAVCGT